MSPAGGSKIWFALNAGQRDSESHFCEVPSSELHRSLPVDQADGTILSQNLPLAAHYHPKLKNQKFVCNFKVRSLRSEISRSNFVFAFIRKSMVSDPEVFLRGLGVAVKAHPVVHDPADSDN